MQFVRTFELYPFLDTTLSLAAAFILGTLIGAERQYRQRTAGLRTNVLVAVGAAAFVDLAQRIAGTTEAVRVISYVVSGIGFLGAGVIMKEGMNVRGLNTAATLWCSAAVGACAGTDMIAEAALLTVFVLAGNTLLRPLVNLINRIPINEQAAEATYEVKVMTSREAMPEMRDLLIERLEEADYPVGDIEISDRGADSVEIIATLVSTAVDPEEIDAVTSYMEDQRDIASATWEGSTKD
ncbi:MULTISPECIES: MgtC/SapB family protein [unclassified Rhizobium]|uniref:MgtC/SapB family protein n=1 Tax=unclassified Rhizobium TaxID=2613769 RepID=UPI0038048C1F